MKRIAWLLAASSGLALGACGSYDPSKPAQGPHPVAATAYQQPASQQRVASQQTAAPVRPTALAPVRTSITEAELPPAPTYVSTAARPTGQARTVTVQPGETVYAISRRTGANPQAIIAENNLRAPYTLVVGQTLRLPDQQEKISNAMSQPTRLDARAEAPSAPQSARVHVVRSGDTLFSVSRATGVSVTEIAQANGLRAPYQLNVGDRLQIPAAAGAPAVTIQREVRTAPAQDVAEIARNVSYTQPAQPAQAAMFAWPVRGAIIGEYGAGGNGRRNDGVNIAAPVGTPVRAAADGEVVYRGAELEGYGNLLLIKHDDGFVTAYAHNDVMLARKGQKVRKGEVVAKVGQTGAASEPQLHFEIRQNLKSVDPLPLLDP